MVKTRPRPLLAFALALLLAAQARAAAEDPIRLPGNPPAPAPLPPAVQRLTAEVWYVIDSDVDILVLTSPAGFVSSSREAGPVKVRGRFVDGTGKTETRTYKGRHVYTLEAAATGRCEVLIIPAGAKDEADVIRRTLDVDVGRPPPVPPDPPTPPPPDPPKPPPATGPLWVVVVEETADAASSRGAFFADTALLSHMREKKHRHRVVDKDVRDKGGSTPADVAGYIRRASGKKLPYLFVVDQDGRPLREGPLPTTPSGLLAILKEVGG